MAKVLKSKKSKGKYQDSEELREAKQTQLRDRLIRVRTPNRLWSILERQNFFVCGYCGQRMALYSPQSLTGREENPMMFYGCGHRCELSGIHRYQFIDNKLITFIYDRFRTIFPNAEGNRKNVQSLVAQFEEIARLDVRRRHLLELLPHAGFNRDDILKEIIDLEKTIKERRDKTAGFDENRPEKSTLFAPIFIAESPAELCTLDLLYLRELVRAAIRRIRFFNETLIVRVTPLTEEELHIDEEGGGKIFNLHLQFDPRSIEIDSILKMIDSDEEQKPEKKPDRPKYAFERTDLDFIMNDEEPSDDFSGFSRSADKVDLELLMTEPGSIKEKEILSKREKKEGEE